MKKQIGFKTKGMNRDLSVSAFNPEFAFENMNLRLSTNENNTLMSWVNEKGTSPISLSDSDNNQVTLNGCVIGTAILNKYLVLFLTNGCVATEGSVQYFDSIYRLEYKSGDDARITMTATRLYNGLESGNLGFSIEHPLETIVSYESDSIQKVYWTDGINQPRLINISPENDESISSYSSTSFDFIPTLQLNETIKVKKILGGGGMFAPGVIQYAFTYYNKYMQESNIFYTTPLHYISYADRGASPEDKVDNVFKITIEDFDDNFEYLRIYSIQRTSINGTPICKRIQDIELSSVSSTSVSFTDTGTVGESIDPTELLYKGGRDILVGTMEHKDGTLFMGDITTSNERPDITLNTQNTPLDSDTRTFYPAFVSSNNYEYANQLTSYKAKLIEGEFEKTDESVPCAGFKNGNIYRCGVQFQDKTGRWTDPILIDNWKINQSPNSDVNVEEDPEGTDDLSLHEIIISNSSDYTIVVSNKAYFALKYDVDGVTNKKVFNVRLGNAGSYSIGKNLSISISGAYIEDGARTTYTNLRFCSAAEAITLGLTNNVQLEPEDPTLKVTDYTWISIAEGTTINGSTQYTVECTSSKESTPQPSPIDPSAGNPVIRINVNIVNNAGTPITLDGRLRFVLGNPDHNGTYFGGYQGLYIRTDNIWFSSAAVTIGIGQTLSFSNLLWQDGDTGCGLGETSPLNAGYFPILDDEGQVAYAANVLIYTESRSDVAICDNLSSSIIFKEGETYTISIARYVAPAATRGLMKTTKVLARGVGDSENTDIKVTVPIIKGTLSSENAASLYRDGYRRARAVVVYPDMQNRNVICQGVAAPTVYTKAGRGEAYRVVGGDDGVSKDLYAQSSWFFRPYYSSVSYREDVNIPTYSGTLAYIEDNLAPNRIKKVEVQGAFFIQNKFVVDWSTLTFHTPDLEFDDSTQTLDYVSGGFKSYYTRNAQVVRTFSDIDIQTETPTISSNAAGFVKKSFVRENAAGIIAGLFYEDFAVNDGTKEEAFKFEPFPQQNAAMKWMVYPWNKGGSLNNDIERPSGFGVTSAVLKQKIISNLRFANSSPRASIGSDLGFRIHLFLSDQDEIIKLHVPNSDYSDIYKGNVDTLLVPDVSDGMYFSLSQNTLGNTVNPPLFTDGVYWKTFAKVFKKQDSTDRGCYYYSSSGWNRPNTNFGKDLGDEYPGLVLKKESIRMKYKSTPHLVLTRGSALTVDNTVQGCLPIIELRRNLNASEAFGGDSKDTLKEQVWIPCGEPVKLWDGRKDEHDNPVYNNVDFYYEWGDTYYQRWDCLKTYAFTPEDINQVVEIGSFMLETYVNIDGRYDRNRGQQSNLYMSPQNFNLLNPVYSQINNFFSYKVQDDDAYNKKKFPNQITWSKTKTSGADVDLWTNVTLASILEMDGDKGSIRKLIRANDQLLCFQDGGVSQVLYNENTQISTTEGVPIEIANSGKVQGKRYISDTIGCSNKWSLTQTPAGIYFMDSINKAIFMYNGQLNNLSSSYGMNAWCKDNIPDDSVIWTPSDYLIKNDGTEIFVNGFQNFVTYYDKLNQDVLFINKEKALAFSEKLGTFTSFYNYEESPYFCNLQDTGIWLKVAAEEEEEEGDVSPHLEYTTSLWKHQAGSYCKFFGENKPYWMILVGNPEPQLDKIFTNLEFRACVDGDGEMETVVPEGGTEPVETGRFIPALPFTDLETWNEYQHGKATLSNKWGHAAFMHPRNGDFSLKRKFRIWRCDIPRSNAPLTADAGLNCYRKEYRPNDRMRNPWLYLKLMKQAVASNKEMDRAEIHDVIMTYFG